MSSRDPVSPVAVVRRFRDKPPDMCDWAWAKVIAAEFGCGPTNIYHIVGGRPTNAPVRDAILDRWTDRRLRLRLRLAQANLLRLRMQATEAKNDIALLRAEMARRRR